MKPALDDPVQHWRRVATLLGATLEREPADRARFLDETCRAEPALKAEVEELVARALTPSFLDSGAVVFAAPLLESRNALLEQRLPEPLRGAVRQLSPIRPAAPIPPLPSAADGDGQYVLEREIARGGMATVYLARDAKHDRRVAVKVLDAQLTGRAAARFVQEIRLTAQLQHPHVLALLDSGVFSSGPLAGRPYYVMPYVAGESLRARLARGRLGMAEAIRLLRDVADALAYAHEQGVIHRDVKPENILLSRGHAVVADFGIAKALDASESTEPSDDTAATTTKASSRIGTPAYMAPEQAATDTPVDHRADLYGWGVVAYELLAGRHPFAGRTSAQFIAAHARAVPAPLQQIAPAVPRRVGALVMQCLAKAPEERPRAASEILETLDAPAALGIVSASTRRWLRTLLGLAIVLFADASGRDRYRTDEPIFLIGTGDAAQDVPAFQAAADRGGDIVLEGHFSFGIPPTKRVDPLLASGWYPAKAQILISRAVNIVGVRDAQGTMTTIESGTIPFYIDARGERVTIKGVRFVSPIHSAILVRAVRGLEISSSRIEGLVPLANGAAGISINTGGEMPLPSSPGNPENVSGHLLIAHNEIDGRGGTAQAPTAGVNVFSIGQSPDREVDLDILGNRISNTTAPAVNVRHVQGKVRVLGNALRTSAETVEDVDAVRLVNSRSILMANNTVECQWPNAAGIQVFSPYVEWPTDSVVVADNDVRMSPPSGAALGDFSSGISIKGYAHGIVIRHNRLSGRARAALATYVFRGGVPEDNAFVDNRLEQFTSTVADIIVGSGVARTHIRGPGSLMDRGTRTLLVR